MKKLIVLSFFPITVKKDQGIGVPTLEMDETEINVLWTLCKQGRKSIYDLQVKTKFSLKESDPSCVESRVPDMTAKEAKAKLVELQNPKSYQRTSIYKIVKKLLAKNLVKLSKDTSGSRTKTIVEPTFQGFILYLQNPLEEGKLEKVLEHYSYVFPFSNKWESMVTVLGKEKCLQALERTIKDFVEIRRARFLLRPLKKFEGFLESPKMMDREVPHAEVTREKDSDVSHFLNSKDGTLLKKSYIAYLIVHDIDRLSGESKEQAERIISKLESEKELTYLEGRRTDANLLFNGSKLKEFLPEHTDLEHFFTGMFVKNLLWNEKIVEKKKEEPKTPDYEVEFY